MRPCCCLATRTGVLILGSILTFNFGLQILVTFIHRDSLTKLFVSDVQFGSIVANQVLMLIMSVMLILGAVYKNRWLLLPFIIFAMINVFSFAIFVIAAGVNLSLEFKGNVLGILLGTLYTFFVMVWALWTAIAYFLDLGRTDGYDGLGVDQSKYGDLESTYPPPRRHSKGDREHGLKPTVVSKMLRDFH